jgi:hypothetical protein
MTAEQIEAGGYAPRLEALEFLEEAASEVWFATQALAECHSSARDRSVVIANSIDPSLWCNWPQRGSAPVGQTRLLYMGTGTHAEDFALVRPSLDRLWQEREGCFDLTLIGVAETVEPAPWLKHLVPPAECTPYPDFVNWLREQGPYDLGIAPLVDTAFNRVKSDIKLLDYSAMGLPALVSDLPTYRADPAFESAIVTNWDQALRDAINRPDRARSQAQAAIAHLWLNRTSRGTGVTLLDRMERLVRSRATVSQGWCNRLNVVRSEQECKNGDPPQLQEP